MFDHLPDYIADLRPSLEKSHPPPIIALGYAADKRFYTLPRYKTELYITNEAGISEDDIDHWNKGMELLSEFATETLAVEILNAIMPKPLGKQSIDLYPKNESANRSINNKAVQKLSEMFGTDDKLREFQRSLVRSSLLCDAEVVNNVLAPYNIDIDQLAVELGKIEEYFTTTEFQSAEEWQRNYSEFSGFVDLEIPGIINIPLRTPAVVSILGAAMSSSAFLYTEFLKDAIHSPIISATVSALNLMPILSSSIDLLFYYCSPEY